VNCIVASLSIQYEKISPGDEPAVISGFVRSAVAGKQISGGLVITSKGRPGEVIWI